MYYYGFFFNVKQTFLLDDKTFKQKFLSFKSVYDIQVKFIKNQHPPPPPFTFTPSFVS